MARSKYTYRIEVLYQGSWVKTAEVSRQYGEGYLQCHRETPGPRIAMRLVRSDGKVVDEGRTLEDASLGMIAGFPTPLQYIEAAQRAVVQAAEVVGRENRRAARRSPLSQRPVEQAEVDAARKLAVDATAFADDWHTLGVSDG